MTKRSMDVSCYERQMKGAHRTGKGVGQHVPAQFSNNALPMAQQVEYVHVQACPSTQPRQASQPGLDGLYMFPITSYKTFTSSTIRIAT
jgi:hypothetical protein